MKKLIFSIIFLLCAMPALADAPTLTLTVEMVFCNLTSQQTVEKVQQIMKADLGGEMTYTIKSRSESSGSFYFSPTPSNNLIQITPNGLK